MAGTTPGVNHVALLIELDDLWATNAALDAGRVVAAADLVALGRLVAVDEPDMVHAVDADAGHLLHAPAVRQRLRPEWIDPEHRRAVLIHGLARRLRERIAHRGHGDERQDT